MQPRTIIGKKVHPIGLGAMAVDEYPVKASDTEAIELFQYAVKQGVGLVDTADVYGLGRNETLLGKALTAEQKKQVIIATKVGCTRPGGTGWGTDGRPEHIKEAVHLSLKRLQITHIELYMLHAPDYTVPLRESISALKELQNTGLIKHIGLSNVNLDQLQEAEKMVEVMSVENHYNCTHKDDEYELLPYLTENNIPYLPYFPLGSGHLLQDKRLRALAEKLSATPSQIALAWILAKWPTAIPIPGTKNKKHLSENMHAADVGLTDTVVAEIDGWF